MYSSIIKGSVATLKYRSTVAWEIFTMPHIAPQPRHTITGSDSGVGVYIYGYGYDESYAWAGSFVRFV